MSLGSMKNAPDCKKKRERDANARIKGILFIYWILSGLKKMIFFFIFSSTVGQPPRLKSEMRLGELLQFYGIQRSYGPAAQSGADRGENGRRPPGSGVEAIDAALGIHGEYVGLVIEADAPHQHLQPESRGQDAPENGKLWYPFMDPCPWKDPGAAGLLWTLRAASKPKFASPTRDGPASRTLGGSQKGCLGSMKGGGCFVSVMSVCN